MLLDERDETMNVQDNEQTEQPASDETPKTKAPKGAKEDQSEAQRMMELYEETFNNIKPGQIVEGTVIDINDKEVLVDIGFKSEGSIPMSEFSNSDLPRNSPT
jgi:small subunit ribosomal protein S1